MADGGAKQKTNEIKQRWLQALPMLISSVYDFIRYIMLLHML